MLPPEELPLEELPLEELPPEDLLNLPQQKLNLNNLNPKLSKHLTIFSDHPHSLPQLLDLYL